MTHTPLFVGTIVLCGGTSRRMSVPDKTALPFADGTLLDSALVGLPAGLVVCVGDPRPLRSPEGAGERRDVIWARERPVGGGPVAGIRAGLDAVLTELDTADPALTDRMETLVAVVAGDQPFAGRVVSELVDCLDEKLRHGPTLGPPPDGVAVTSPGREAPALLLAVYRVRSLDAAVPHDADDLGVYQTLSDLLIEVADADRFASEHLAVDVDDPADLERALALQARLT